MRKETPFSLPNFEGSLDFLLRLIQREEIDIYDVPIQELIRQHLAGEEEEKLVQGTEFIGAAAWLILQKSNTMLPKERQSVDELEVAPDPHFEVIHHLIDYCRFKRAAKELCLFEEKAAACYFRAIEPPEEKGWLLVNSVSFAELSHIFQEAMKRAVQKSPEIYEEPWRVADKIKAIRSSLQQISSFPIMHLFLPSQSRLEIIVIFLAILEMMKMGELVLEQGAINYTL